MMRAIVDAGIQDEEWCRAHADGYDELLGELAARTGRGLRRRLRRAGGGHRAGRARVRLHAAGVGAGSAWALSATQVHRRGDRLLGDRSPA